jgi:hypothetical protein
MTRKHRLVAQKAQRGLVDRLVGAQHAAPQLDNR